MSIRQWTTVFLIDSPKPREIVLLQRAAERQFAPGWYTGIGGKKEENESIIDAAYRELDEETGIQDITLTQFAQAHISNLGKVLHYFWAIYPHSNLPRCTEGSLEWTSLNQILSKRIIPTTKLVLEEWQKRSFALDQSWTLTCESKSEQFGMAHDLVITHVVERLEF